jgi:hypothetical protein
MINLKTIATDCKTDLCECCRIADEAKSREEVYCQNCEDFLKTEFVCIKCGEPDFYEGATCPVLCASCRYPFDDFELIKTNLQSRIEFHIDFSANE